MMINVLSLGIILYIRDEVNSKHRGYCYRTNQDSRITKINTVNIAP